MRIVFCALSLVSLGMLAAAGAPQDVVQRLASAPLRFEPASGVPSGVHGNAFVARGLRSQYSFSHNGAVLNAGGKTVGLTFEGAAAGARLGGLDQLRSTTNILRGNDPAKWQRAIPNYSRLHVSGLYPGVDLMYYGSGSELEYDLVVKPECDPRQVRLRFSGHPYIDGHGNLVGGFVQKPAVAYQVAASGQRVPVRSRYRKNSDGTFGFALGHYDKTRDLIIDPVLSLSAYIGGSLQDVGTAIGHDSLGYVYVAGTTASNDLNDQGTPAQAGLTGTSNIFIAKLDPHVDSQNQLAFLTIVGGAGGDVLNDMLVTPGGFVYLTGQTTSTNFPNVNGSQTAISGTSDAFVMWLDLSQFQTTINYSTYAGGTGDDIGNGVAIDTHGRIFLAGTTRSSDFPIVNGFQAVNGSTQTAFAAAFDPSQSGAATMIYSTYMGGAFGETGNGVAVAADGTFWVGGSTYSSDFPVIGFPFQSQYHPGGDGFLVQLNAGLTGGASQLYATYLGGSGPDEVKKVIIDPAGRIIAAGYTGSADFPTTATALQANYGGNFDAFVAILNPKNANSQLVYSTYFGGSQADIPFDLKLDPNGSLYVTGFTTSPDLTVSGNALEPTYDTNHPTLDGFALKFNPALPSLGSIQYSSYIEGVGRQIAYGIDYDVSGNIYVTGYTTAPLFDSIGGAPKITSPGNTDAFVMGINACLYNLSSAAETFPVQGGSDTVSFVTSTASCTWTASSPVPWITLSPASGTGNGAVKITVQANTGASRTGTLTIAGSPFIVSQ